MSCLSSYDLLVPELGLSCAILGYVVRTRMRKWTECGCRTEKRSALLGTEAEAWR